MRDYLIGTNYGIPKANAIGATSGSAARPVDDADLAAGQYRGLSLLAQRDGRSPEVLAEPTQRSMPLRAVAIAIWQDTYPGTKQDRRELL